MKRVCLGKISAAHGIKGLVKIFPYGDDISLLEGELFTAEQGGETLTISLKNPLGKYILAAVKGCTERNAAEALKGTALWTSRDALPGLGEDEFYIEDLIGLEARNEKDEIIGKVIAVENYGAGDLIEIQPVSGQSFLMPFNDETVIEITGSVKLQNFEQYKDLS